MTRHNIPHDTIRSWIIDNFEEVIILKDFDSSNIETFPIRSLPQKTIEFNTESLRDELFLPNKKAASVAESVLSILLNSNVRRGGLPKIEQFIPKFLQDISYFVDKSLPVQVVLPSLPHKKLSPITTGHSIDFVDLGDYLCLQQLRNIILSVKNVYEPGVQITILPDGITLAHIFARSNIAGVKSYSRKLTTIQRELGLENLILFKDLNDLFLSEPTFDEDKAIIKSLLNELASKNTTINVGMNILQKAMLFNVPLDHPIEDHLRIMKLPLADMPKDVKDQLEYAAFEYAAILLAMKKSGMIRKAYPDAIRASVHNKVVPNLPINLINSTSLIFPYNGIPVVRRSKLEKNGNIRKATRIMRLYEIYKYPSATAVYRKGDGEPFWYEIDSLSEKAV